MKLSNRQRREIRDTLDRARRALSIRRYSVCEQLCRKVESLYPNHPDALNLRAICAAETGRPDEAIRLLDQAAALAPNRSEFHVNLGGLLLVNERFEDAIKSYRQALEIAPRELTALTGLGNALLSTRRNEEAIEILEKVRRRSPDNINVHLKLFSAHHALLHTEQAQECLQHILKIAPDHADAHFRMGHIALEQGKMAEAEAKVRTCLDICPDHGPAYGVLATIKKFKSPNDADITAMKNLYEKDTTDTDKKIILNFALGKAMDDVKQYDQAFTYLSEGHSLWHKQNHYNAEAALAEVERIIAAFDRTALSHSSDNDNDTPIFVIGMPRCGSTLVELILAAHPYVESRGECDILVSEVLNTLDEEAPSPERLAAFTPEQWSQVGRLYLEHMKNGGPVAPHVTDKTLSNAYHVGTIHCALPRAKIVHVRRHPLDTCLSIYKNNLVGADFGYGRDLAQMGRYYRMYLRLMQHWRDVLPPGVMHELDYEHLIADQEQETRKLLAFCNLPWDDQCLQFNKAKTIVRTSSMSQVRRPMYTDSMAAWRRYENHLQPLIEALGPEYSIAYKPGIR